MAVPLIKIPYSKENVEKFSELLEPKFKELKWEWAFLGIPVKEDIEKLFNDMIEELNDYSTTGGLFVEKNKNGKILIGVDRKFNKVISRQELEYFFKKKPKRMLRF